MILDEEKRGKTCGYIYRHGRYSVPHARGPLCRYNSQISIIILDDSFFALPFHLSLLTGISSKSAFSFSYVVLYEIKNDKSVFNIDRFREMRYNSINKNKISVINLEGAIV